MRIDEYQNAKKEMLSLYTIFKKKYDVIALLRGISFICLVLDIVGIFITINIFLIILGFLLFGAFIALIFVHNNISSKKDYYKNKVLVIEEYISRINGNWKITFPNTGMNIYRKEIKNKSLTDLDIFGEASLFSFLNITRTNGGKRKLALRLSNIEKTPEKLLLSQEAVKELASDVESSWDFQTKSYNIENNIRLQNIYSNEKKADSKINFYIGISLSIALLAIVILWACNIVSFGYILIPMIFQLFNTIIYIKVNKEFLKIIDDTMSICTTLDNAFSSMKDKKYKSKKMQTIYEKITSSSSGLKKISNLGSWDTLRNNLITFIIGNVLFPFSISIIYLYQKELINNEKVIKEGIESFEELEVLMSLAIIGQVRDNICMPQLSTKIEIHTKNMAHPLIDESSVVSNDFYTSQGVNVITGSNMSGKTSFMRTIGVNLILMNAGTYVCAESFTSNYFKIFTSMKITDDISKGISTFYAELIQIREAVEYQKTNKNMITLIDEVFKGTNSNDRIKGAISLVNKLNSENSIVVITTHDFEICEINIPNIYNYNFSEYYVNNEIKFTYKINKGKCQTTNAEFLMKLVGIID